MEKQVISWKNKGKFFKYKEHDIFYIQEGSGPSLLILHGYPYSSFDWHLVWKELVKNYAVVILDLLGMGFSDKPENHTYSFEDHCNCINQFTHHLGIKELHILSHDLGVSIAQELIHRDQINQNKFRILSSVFLNGGLFMEVNKPRLIQILLSQSPKPIGRYISKKITKIKLDTSIKEVFGPNTQPDDHMLEMLWQILNYKDGKSIAYLIGRLVFDKKNHQKKWIHAMKTTSIKMCFINGPFDPNSGIKMVEKYLEIIPNASVKLLHKDIGHWPQLEDPKAVLDAYFAFRIEMNRCIHGR